MVFFDGSHRTFMNSDATVFFLEVLPTLPAGTLVGIHDIYLPDDYPADWTTATTPSSTCSRPTCWPGATGSSHGSRPGTSAGHTRSARAWTRSVGRPGLAGVERHGGAFWLEITSESG